MYCKMTENTPRQTKVDGSATDGKSWREPQKALHVKARCRVYPGTERFAVPDHKVPWSEPFPDYRPRNYTAADVAVQPVWADLDFSLPTFRDSMPAWNRVDGKINRVSHEGTYHLDPKSGLPLNPRGRTGMVGRGLLGRWGPNHAADPIVTRWKREAGGESIIKRGGKPVAQFIAVQRRDNNEWALPGGMVDAGEVISMTLKREFGEEALNSLEISEDEKQEIEKHMDTLFHGGKEIYRGYVDDPRNTDNAWMETTAINFHDHHGDSVAKFRLHAGDDAMGVKWLDLDSGLELFASHVLFLQNTAQHLGAHW